MNLPLRLLLTLLFSLCLAPSVTAAYTFLGNLISYEQNKTGLVLTCEQEYRLYLSFYDSGTVRITLKRPNYEADSLNYPLVEFTGDPVAFELLDYENELHLVTAELDISISKHPCRIAVYDRQGILISEDDPGMGIGWDGNEVRCWKQIHESDRFFGLGGKGGNLNRRGRELVLWNTDFPAYDNRTDPLYQSIPFFIKLREGTASGVYFNNSYRSRFNFQAGNLRYYSFSAEGGDLDYFFINGPDFNDVLRRYAAITGTTPLPPLWSLGYQQSRWSYYPDTEVLALARTFRDKRIPCDVIYLDIHYMDDYRVFTWHPDRFPKPKQMLSDLERDGFKVVTIIDPGVKVDSQYPVARSGLEQDCFVKYPDGEIYVGEVWPGPSYFPDYSLPVTRDWWGKWIGDWLKTGVDGCWIDMNEPAVWGQAFPLETIFNDDGRISSHKKLHNLYGLLMAKATYEGAIAAQPNQRPFVLTRAGFAGEQRYSSVWTGDNVANEEHLALGIRMVLSQSLSGVPFCGTDVGGFIDTPSPELFLRWLQVGSVMPLFRNHTHYGSRDQEPWAFGEDIEWMARETIEFRYSLIPYLYSLFYQTSQDGSPILRPLFYHDQDDNMAFHDYYQEQFFIGEKLLAAPVTKTDHYFKKVYLPEGKWLNWHTREILEGPGEFFVEAPLERMPLFLREGAIIPTRDPQQYTGEKPLNELYLDIFPSRNTGSFVYYEDDGRSFEYREGKYNSIRWECADQDSLIWFSQTYEHSGYRSPPRTISLRFHDLDRKPEVVMEIDDQSGLKQTQAVDSFYDSERRLLSISIPQNIPEYHLRLYREIR